MAFHDVNAVETFLNAGNLQNLRAAEDHRMPNGKMAYVRSVRALFTLDKSSSVSINDQTVVATRSGVGRWIQLGSGSTTEQTQASWFVDSVSGSDENDGLTASTALKSLIALDRRLGNGRIKQNTSITLSGDFSSEILVVRVGAEIDPATNLPYLLSINGTRQTLYAGTVTTFNAGSATTTPRNITVSGIDWDTAGPGGTSLICKRVRNLADGSVCWLIEKDGVDASKAYISNPRTLGNPSDIIGGGGSINPSDQFVVEALTQVSAIVYEPQTAISVAIIQDIGSGTPPSFGTLIQLDSIKSIAPFLGILAFGCDISPCVFGSATSFVGCRLENAIFIGQHAVVSVCWADMPMRSAATELLICAGTVSKGSGLIAPVDIGYASTITFVGGGGGAYDAGVGVEVSRGTKIGCIGGFFAGTIFGGGNTVGVHLHPDCALVYGNKSLPTITGTTEVTVGATNTAWATIDAASGFVDSPSLARVAKDV